MTALRRFVNRIKDTASEKKRKGKETKEKETRVEHAFTREEKEKFSSFSRIETDD